MILIAQAVPHYLELIKLQLKHRQNFVSGIANVSIWLSIGLSIIKHLLDQVRIGLISQFCSAHYFCFKVKQSTVIIASRKISSSTII